MRTTEGIILKKIDVGEADALYVLYTKDCGKITAHARGVRKQGAKLRGHLEPLSWSTVRLIRVKNGEKLVGASLRSYWQDLRTRQSTLEVASYVVRRIDEECFPGERDAPLWELVTRTLVLLDSGDVVASDYERFREEFDRGLAYCLGHGRGDAEAGGEARSRSLTGALDGKR